MMTRQQVSFFLSDAEAVARIVQADVDRDWAFFGTGAQVWIGQTYLRLRDAGYPVQLTAVPPTEGVVLVHADHLHKLIAAQPLLPKTVIVSARADRRPKPSARFEIVQNNSSAGGRVIYVPHWPQPGLIPRDAARGTVVATASFKGLGAELLDGAEGQTWSEALAAHEIGWREDAVKWQGSSAVYDALAWNDYADVDLIIAIRPPRADAYLNKPASKLVNAWLAGVPAILGPEVAYQELRRSDLDYIEAKTAREALDAAVRLKGDPGLYQAMITNGTERAKDFTPELITATWGRVLFDTAASAFSQRIWRRNLRLGTSGLKARTRARVRRIKRLFL